MPTQAMLTPEQNAVVQHTDKPALVVAGAGTGKTHTICERVANLIENGCDPHTIMMLTFTNAAADEMCERIARRVGQDKASQIISGTFHATAAKMLRLHGWKHSIMIDVDTYQTVTTKNFRILSALDDTDNVSLVRGQYAQTNNDPSFDQIDFPGAETLASMISEYENRGFADISEVLKFERYKKYRSRQIETHLRQFLIQYQQYKADNNLLSFDDLITEWTTLIESNPNTVTPISHVIVDEAQDMNSRQHDIIEALLLHMTGDDVMLVGDAAQSIYGWRGSDVELFDNFVTNHQGAVTYHLSHNFRSQPEILDTANQVLKNATLKNVTKLVSGRKDLAAKRLRIPCQIKTPKYDSANAYITTDELYNKKHSETLAVIARSSSELRIVESELIGQQTPYEFRGGIKFNELKYIRDIMTLLEMAFREQNVSTAECARIMKNNYDLIGEKTAGNIAQNGFPNFLTHHGFENRHGQRANAVKNMCQDLTQAKLLISSQPWPESVNEACEWYLAMFQREGKKRIAHERSKKTPAELREKLKTQLEETARHFEILKQIAKKETSLPTFCDRMALESPNLNDKKPELILTTIHSAKGLEWDRVIVLNVIGDVFPGEPRETDPELIEKELEEQRRCLYVAVTRARERLVMTMPQYIRHGPFTQSTKPCPYL